MNIQMKHIPNRGLLPAVGWIVVWMSLCVPSLFARPLWNDYLGKSNEWYRSDEGRRVADNILSWQDQYGSWPKNEETASTRFTGKQGELKGTFDNKATTGEMRVLACAYRATQDERYKKAFIRGLDLIFKAQYPTGGWPQFYPPSKAYHRYITFNDGVMVRLLMLLRNIAVSGEYDFVDADRRAAAQEAFDRGIDCILKCQIRVNGKLTVWCAQHDEIDYSPRPARSYELVSLSGGESADVLCLLMSIDDPSDKVVEGVNAGVEWYKQSAIKHTRIEYVNGRRTLVHDPDAPPMWARFYEIETNRPLYADRDGIPKYEYSLLDFERASGYKWLSDWGEEVFSTYDKWKKRWYDRVTGKETFVILIIGDSTVCEYKENDVRRGWGHYIKEYFTDKIRVFNRARSGRSTKTFIKQGLWAESLKDNPDYVLIQFGHNDSHAPDRPESTNAETDYRDYLRQYIDESRAAGAVPILVTPMHRRKFNEDGTLKDTLQPYADAMKAVGKEKGVAVIDLHKMSGELFFKLGDAGSMEMANTPDDRTHFNEKGARAMAELVMSQLPDAEPLLKPYLKSEQ